MQNQSAEQLHLQVCSNSDKCSRREQGSQLKPPVQGLSWFPWVSYTSEEPSLGLSNECKQPEPVLWGWTAHATCILMSLYPFPSMEQQWKKGWGEVLQ